MSKSQQNKVSRQTGQHKRLDEAVSLHPHTMERRVQTGLLHWRLVDKGIEGQLPIELEEEGSEGELGSQDVGATERDWLAGLPVGLSTGRNCELRCRKS